MARRPTRFHDVFPRDAIDRSVFIAAFVIGVLGGTILKAIGVHALYTALFSACVLVSYALLSWVAGRIKIEPETIGDNCYYLGFLFTLASLAFTLYQLADDTSADVQIPAVISGFGVALSSTIVGVFLRVLLMQMRVDFISKEQELRAEINRAYSELRKQMTVSVSQMKAFSTESLQHAAERDERLRASTEAFVIDHTEAVKLAGQQLGESLDTVVRETLTQSLQDVAEALTATSQLSHSTLEQFVTSVQQMQGELMSLHGATLAERERQKQRFNADFDAMDLQMKGHTETMKKYADVLATSVEQMESGIGTQIDTLQQQIAGHSSTLLQITQDHQEKLDAFSQATQQATARFDDKINPALETFHERLVRLSETPDAEIEPEKTSLLRSLWSK